MRLKKEAASQNSPVRNFIGYNLRENKVRNNSSWSPSLTSLVSKYTYSNFIGRFASGNRNFGEISKNTYTDLTRRNNAIFQKETVLNIRHNTNPERTREDLSDLNIEYDINDNDFSKNTNCHVKTEKNGTLSIDNCYKNFRGILQKTTVHTETEIVLSNNKKYFLCKRAFLSSGYRLSSSAGEFRASYTILNSEQKEVELIESRVLYSIFIQKEEDSKNKEIKKEKINKIYDNHILNKNGKRMETSPEELFEKMNELDNAPEKVISEYEKFLDYGHLKAPLAAGKQRRLKSIERKNAQAGSTTEE